MAVLLIVLLFVIILLQHRLFFATAAPTTQQQLQLQRQKRCNVPTKSNYKKRNIRKLLLQQQHNISARNSYSFEMKIDNMVFHFSRGGGSSSPAASSKASSSSTSPPWVNGMKNAIASASAAACCKTILQPIDAIKTVQQFSSTKLTLLAAGKQLVSRPGGITNLYAGLGVSVIGSMPSVGLYFGVYSYCKQKLLHMQENNKASNTILFNPTVCIALAAAIGNTVASVSRVPYEVAKQKLQTGQYVSTVAMVKAMYKTPSIIPDMFFPKGGIAIQMIRDIPYAVVTLLLYEHLQQRWNSNADTSKGTKGSTPMDFMIGGIAGGVGSFVTNPMDVIKTRLQTNSAVYNGSVMQCARSIYQENGAPTFLRGAVPRLIHKVPANAFFFYFYELFKSILNV